MSADSTSYEFAFETRFSKKNHDARRDIGRTKKIRTNKPANPSGLPNRILVALSWNLKPGCILRLNPLLAERSIKSCQRRCGTGKDAIQEMPGQPSRIGKTLRDGAPRRINQAATAPRSDRVALGRM